MYIRTSARMQRFEARSGGREKQTIQCKGISICKDWKGPRLVANNAPHGEEKKWERQAHSIHRLHAHGDIAPVGADGHAVLQVAAPISWSELIVFWFGALGPSNVAPWVIQVWAGPVGGIWIR